MSWLTSSWSDLGVTAGKAVLMYATALVGLRLGERRTLAQWTAIDFAAGGRHRRHHRPHRSC